MDQIEPLKKRFNSSDYYFISDLDLFILRLQHALSDDLKKEPFLKNGEPRVVYPKSGNVFIHGYKNIVKYSEESTKYIHDECETLSEFINSNKNKALDKRLWFQKHKRFEEESEFRIVYFACKERGGAETYTTNDDFLIIPVDLTGAISKKAIPIE